MKALREAIAAVYRQVDAPAWAAPNLDGLLDVLRDLSWLPEGDVVVRLPPAADLSDDDAGRLVAVLVQAENESASGPRRVRLHR